MTLEDKIKTAREVITIALAAATSPVVMLSGGRDSLLLLHLVRQVRPEHKSVVWWGESVKDQEKRNEFTLGIIKEWDLLAFSYPPSQMDVVQGENGNLEIVNIIDVGGSGSVVLPIGVAKRLDPENFACGLDFLNKPIVPWGSIEPQFDVYFSGHRSSDVDPVQGSIALDGWAAQNGAAWFVYPLKDFTDADVIELTERWGLPLNTKRYIDGVDDGQSAYNPDSYNCCVECLVSRPNEPLAECPRLGGQTVQRIGNLLDPQGRAQTWKSRFINLSQPVSG